MCVFRRGGGRGAWLWRLAGLLCGVISSLCIDCLTSLPPLLALKGCREWEGKVSLSPAAFLSWMCFCPSPQEGCLSLVTERAWLCWEFGCGFPRLGDNDKSLGQGLGRRKGPECESFHLSIPPFIPSPIHPSPHSSPLPSIHPTPPPFTFLPTDPSTYSSSGPPSNPSASIQ